MKIQINTDNHIEGLEALAEEAEATITGTLGHLASDITRVEVHLSDENGEKTGGYDKRCMLEARLEGHQPIAVTDESDSLDGAIAGAADKLKHALASTLGRLHETQSPHHSPRETHNEKQHDDSGENQIRRSGTSVLPPGRRG